MQYVEKLSAPTKGETRRNLNQELLSSNKKINFFSFFNLVTSKSYVPVSNCIFEHILTNVSLSPLEKLYYFFVDSLATINANSGKKRAAALPSERWATKLSCSRAQIFSMQKNLEKKGYFVIIKTKNSCGQNKRNMIIPAIPDPIFEELSKSPSKRGEHLPYDPSVESKRDYLARTKLFVKLNYKLLYAITASDELNSFQKVIWLDFYMKCYKNSSVLLKNIEKKDTDFSFISSYKELASRYCCNQKHLSRSIKSLEKFGFVNSKRFYLKKGSADQDRQDKCLWKISLKLSKNTRVLMTQAIDRASFKGEEFAKQSGTFSDPYVAKFSLLLNKDFQTENVRIRSTTKIPITKVDQTNCSGDEENSRNNPNQISQNKKLKDFYPLTEEDCKTLQSLSKRRFSLNSMNEILLDMSKRLTAHYFKSKQAFLSYMGKAFAYELRDAVKISNNGFRIKNNLTSEEINYREREKYLAEIENNPGNSPDLQLKRKLAAVLNPAQSYGLLKAYNYITRVGKTAYLYLNKHIQLSELDRKIILKQVQGVYENVNLVNDYFEFIEMLEIVTNDAAVNTELNQQTVAILPLSNWNHICSKLIDIS